MADTTICNITGATRLPRVAKSAKVRAEEAAWTALERDAARYRWLRKNYLQGNQPFIPRIIPKQPSPLLYGPVTTEAEYDQAVDQQAAGSMRVKITR